MTDRHSAEHLEAVRRVRVESGRLGGRPQTPPPAEVVQRIVSAVEAGDGWSRIAAALNADDTVPPPVGGSKWWASSVQRVYRRATGVDPDRPAT
ncbi:hypothetical protein ACIBSW_06885 [Actinoplanes sp. NPDC049668]|uniref:hypothetical protein n=1 Tax=unclassified Actinoplanes TaxID=2626549 RepID=UPI0033A76A40